MKNILLTNDVSLFCNNSRIGINNNPWIIHITSPLSQLNFLLHLEIYSSLWCQNTTQLVKDQGLLCAFRWAEFKISQKCHQPDLGLHHPKPQARADPRTLTKRQVRATGTICNFLGFKSFWPKLLRIFVVLRIHVNTEDRNDIQETFGKDHVHSRHLVILCHLSEQSGHGWELPQCFWKEGQGML